MAKIIKMSGISSKMSGNSAKCVTMSEWVTNPLVRPKMSKTARNVWQLAGRQFGDLGFDLSMCSLLGPMI